MDSLQLNALQEAILELRGNGKTEHEIFQTVRMSEVGCLFFNNLVLCMDSDPLKGFNSDNEELTEEEEIDALTQRSTQGLNGEEHERPTKEDIITTGKEKVIDISLVKEMLESPDSITQQIKDDILKGKLPQGNIRKLKKSAARVNPGITLEEPTD